MALLIDNSKRRILPIWRSFDSTKSELQPLYPSKIKRGNISQYIFEWVNNKNMATAGDLLSAAIVNGCQDNEEVIDAANYILYSNEDSNYALTKVSKNILDSNIDTDTLSTTIELYSYIAELKKLLITYPTDSILHIEIARMYLLLGQLHFAQKHVENALYFDHNNRYVVRCAARFYIHLKKPEQALSIIRKSVLTKIDPWLLASEISICQLLDKTSPNIKKGLRIIESSHFDPFNTTELCAAIGTEELIHGAYTKSRKLFNNALNCPNSNSLAQAEWVNNETNLSLDFTSINIDSECFWEAKCYNSFNSNDYVKSLQYAKQWIAQEPYSTRAILYAYELAISYLRDLKSSQEIMDNALKNHKGNPIFINNYAYALALDGKLMDAENVISKLKKINFSSSETIDICLLATKGMIAFRKGDAENGIKLYLNAIEKSKKRSDDPQLNHSAVLNFCRELLIFDNSEEHQTYVKGILERLPDYQNDREIENLKDQVHTLLST